MTGVQTCALPICGGAAVVAVDIEAVRAAKEFPAALLDEHAVPKRERLIQQRLLRAAIGRLDHLDPHFGTREARALIAKPAHAPSVQAQNR